MKTCNAHPAVQQITNAPKIRNSIQVPSVRFSRTFIVTCTFRFILIWLRVKTSFSVLSNAWSERQACYSSSSKRFGGNIFYFGRNEEENKAEGGNLLHTNTHTYTYTHTHTHPHIHIHTKINGCFISRSLVVFKPFPP